MKTIKSILLAVIFLSSAVTLSAGNDPAEDLKDLRSEISSMVSDLDLSDIKGNIYRVEIQLMINSKNEIVVMSTTSSVLDYELKSRLNYKEVKSHEVRQSQLYVVPIVFKK